MDTSAAEKALRDFSATLIHLSENCGGDLALEGHMVRLYACHLSLMSEYELSAMLAKVAEIVRVLTNWDVGRARPVLMRGAHTLLTIIASNKSNFTPEEVRAVEVVRRILVQRTEMQAQEFGELSEERILQQFVLPARAAADVAVKALVDLAKEATKDE